MSAPVCLILDPTTVTVVSRDGTETHSVSWSPDAPEAMVASVRALVGTPSFLVVVIGLGFLEIAQPELPPMAIDARRALLWRDGDRYFPLEEPLAVVCTHTFALALSARRLNTWISAIGDIAPVRAIVTTPQLCARLVMTGTCTIPAAPDERGVLEVRDGLLQSVRRVRLDASNLVATPINDWSVPASTQALGHEALHWHDTTLDSQLLDASLTARIHRARQRRWTTSVVLAVASVLLLVWSADRWRGAQLTALHGQATALTDRAASALRADARRSRAHDELALLAAADAARRAPDAPLAVLAQLSRILPKDAFVQRLEWDGQQWRVDGTADNARRLVPLLDGDAHFRDVRIAMASQRFLDAGRQRESFAIGFRLRPLAEGAHDTP